jgi:pimeloyl-ACP methyl ester carboxylesterase
LLSASTFIAAGCGTTPVEPAVEGAPKSESVRFPSRDATLAGDIHLPAGEPIGGLVLVHGSGREPRMTDLARIFASDGFAVLTYDKRGVGESGGDFEQTYNISWDNLHLLAADADAAVATLAAHPALDGKPIGLFGISQAGWIIPIAAAGDRRVRFIALWSGPVCRVSDELEASIASAERAQAEAQSAAAAGQELPPIEAIRGYMLQIRADGTDVDPRALLRVLDIPGLWVFGGKDDIIPTELSIQLLDELIAEGYPNFERQVVPEAGHAMAGAFREAYTLSRDWMRQAALASS